MEPPVVLEAKRTECNGVEWSGVRLEWYGMWRGMGGSRGILRGARGMGDEWVGSLDGCLDSWLV
jgi:hypothetical protein